VGDGAVKSQAIFKGRRRKRARYSRLKRTTSSTTTCGQQLLRRPDKPPAVASPVSRPHYQVTGPPQFTSRSEKCGGVAQHDKGSSRGPSHPGRLARTPLGVGIWVGGGANATWGEWETERSGATDGNEIAVRLSLAGFGHAHVRSDKVELASEVWSRRCAMGTRRRRH